MNAQVAIAEAVKFYESAPTWFLAADLRQAYKNGTPNVARIIEYVLGDRAPYIRCYVDGTRLPSEVGESARPEDYLPRDYAGQVIPPKHI
jgi:hypothetical protein